MIKSLLSALLLLQIGAVQAADQERARAIVEERCHICHGYQGEGASAIYPRLAAQHPEYIAKQLADFKSGKRKSDVMNEMAADLTGEEMAALGEYFSSQPPKAYRMRDKALTAVGYYIFHKGNRFSGVAACESCHGPEGHGTHKLPRLAGQHKRYIVSQLQDFNQRVRTNDNAVMHSIASRLTELEIEAVARYISTLK